LIAAALKRPFRARTESAVRLIEFKGFLRIIRIIRVE
jgi:hypothetical protein